MSLDPPLNPHPQAAMSPEPQPEIFAHPPLTPPVDNSPIRRILPGVLSAAAVLGLLLVMLLVVLPRLSQPHSVRSSSLPPEDSAAPPSAALPVQPPAAAQRSAEQAATPLPLLVTLYSAGSGKHVPVGKPVLISAYASLPPAGSATIAIHYTRNGGPQSLLTLAQGSLSTASWTPDAPGHYVFSASASDSRKVSAFSHRLAIDADAALAARPLPVPILSPALPPVKAAPVQAIHVRQPALRRIVAGLAAARLIPPKRLTPRLLTPKRLAPKHLVPKPRPVPASSKAYHVAAASFVVRPVAETLAGALRRRGFHAFVRVTTRPHHKPTYTVETGDFLRSPDAQKQAETLKHSGYPAFVSH